MQIEGFMRIVIHPMKNEAAVKQAFDDKAKFRKYRFTEPPDRMPYAVLSKYEDTPEQVARRVGQRAELLDAVFGEAKESRYIQRFDWEIGDKYIKPSEEIFEEVDDPLKATLMFLVYRNWQIALAAGESMLFSYLVDRHFDISTGYRLGRTKVAGGVLKDCHMLKDAVRTCDIIRSLAAQQSIPFKVND